VNRRISIFLPYGSLRAHIDDVRRAFADVNVGVTGGNALSNDEMVAVQQDTLLATALALVGVAVLFIVRFRQVGDRYSRSAC